MPAPGSNAPWHELLAASSDLVRGDVERILDTAIALVTAQGLQATRIEQIAVNLVENAAKYTPAGKAIRVRVAEEGGESGEGTGAGGCRPGGLERHAVERHAKPRAPRKPKVDKA